MPDAPRLSIPAFSTPPDEGERGVVPALGWAIAGEGESQSEQIVDLSSWKGGEQKTPLAPLVRGVRDSPFSIY